MDYNPEHQSIECSEPERQSYQEQGLQPSIYWAILYDQSSPQWKCGIFSLNILPSQSINQFLSEMTHMRQDCHPMAFIDSVQPNAKEPKYHIWPVKILKYLDVKIIPDFHGNDIRCEVAFTKDLKALKERVKREVIESRPFSRVPTTKSASVDFIITAGCEGTSSGRFRIRLESDLEGETKEKDYVAYFVREPPDPPFQPAGTPQTLDPQNVTPSLFELPGRN